MKWDELLGLMSLEELYLTHPTIRRPRRQHYMGHALSRIKFYASIHPSGREYAIDVINRFIGAMNGPDLSEEEICVAYDERIAVLEAAPMN